MKMIGIYSGAFDPVHDGHVAFAEAARSALGCDEIVFLPDYMPPHKPHISPIQKRVTGLAERLADEQQLSVCDPPRHAFSFANTLPYLYTRYPDSQFAFLVGSDVALTLPGWNEIAELPNGTQFAVAVRSDCDERALEAALQNLPAHCSYTLIHTPHAHLRSSDIRGSY